MALRSESTNTMQMVPTRFTEWARNAGGVSEFTTVEALEQIESEIETIRNALFKFHSLLVIERIGSRIFRGPIPFFLHRLFSNHCFLLVYGPSLSLDLLMLIFEGLRHGEWENVINSQWTKSIFSNAMLWVVFNFKHSQILPLNDPRKMTFVRAMDVLRCLSGLHSRLFQHPTARVSVMARKICESMVHFFSVIPPYGN